MSPVPRLQNMSAHWVIPQRSTTKRRAIWSGDLATTGSLLEPTSILSPLKEKAGQIYSPGCGSTSTQRPICTLVKVPQRGHKEGERAEHEHE